MPGFELFGDKEKAEVSDVLDSGVLMRYGFDSMRKGHWKALELEGLLTERMQVKYAQLTSSGTSALTVAMASAGVGAGDEVILPTFTFVASFESVLTLGAIPILVDVDDTLTLDPMAVANAITEKTKAIMPVHMCGSMADLRALKSLCDRHDLLLIEDACQAIGGTFEGKPLGSYGDLGCFSFDYVKTVTCGEGGAIITNNERYKSNADHYSDHGHDHKGNDRGAENHPFLGYNYRISELHAAVGVAQIKRLDEFLNLQKRHYEILRKALETIPDVMFRRVPKGGEESYAFLSFFLSSRELAKNVQSALISEGIDACFYWFDNNWHYYRKWQHLFERRTLGALPDEVNRGLPNYGNTEFPQSDEWVGRTISCLVKLGWSEEEVTRRAAKMADIVRSCL